MIANTYKFMNNVVAFQKTVGMNIIGTFPDQDAAQVHLVPKLSEPRDARTKVPSDVPSETWKSGKLRGGISDTGLAGSKCS